MQEMEWESGAIKQIVNKTDEPRHEISNNVAFWQV